MFSFLSLFFFHLQDKLNVSWAYSPFFSSFHTHGHKATHTLAQCLYSASIYTPHQAYFISLYRLISISLSLLPGVAIVLIVLNS